MPIPEAVFDRFPVLRTRRLLLREIEPHDAAAILAMRQSQKVNQFIARQPMPNLDDAAALVAKTREAFRTKTAIGWAGLVAGQGTCIGTCGFNRIDYRNHRAEIGGELSTDYWGTRLAVEAVSAIAGFGFEKLGLHAIEAFVSPHNRGATFLLQSLGFEQEAYFKDRIFFQNAYLDMAVYTLFKNNFKPAK